MTEEFSEPLSTSSRRLGRTLADKWQLHELLGEGGAGSVYVATDKTGARVAVKMLHPELAVEESVRTRFVRESYVANRIDHPGVVRVLEDGEDEDGTPYIVMELLDGETFEARWTRKGGKLPVSEVLWLADRTLHVLAAAHGKGIVHRDIKPENLFLTYDRKLKVLDFGIARLGGASDAVTKVGTILGTLAFMPPEQARGATAEVGVQSDLWSVGATMYTLLSGRLVRDDQDVAKLLREAGQSKVPSLAVVAPELPPELIELVDYALSLEMKVRWPTAKMMRRAIRMVHGQLRRDSFRASRVDLDEDDGEVSEPSFGVIANRSIEPPPMSVAYPSEHHRVAPPAPLGLENIASPRSAAIVTLNSAVSAPPSAPAPKPVLVAAPKPTPAPPSAREPPQSSITREVITVRRPNSKKRARAPSTSPLTWALVGVIVTLALVVVVMLARR